MKDSKDILYTIEKATEDIKFDLNELESAKTNLIIVNYLKKLIKL